MISKKRYIQLLERANSHEFMLQKTGAQDELLDKITLAMQQNNDCI